MKFIKKIYLWLTTICLSSLILVIGCSSNNSENIKVLVNVKDAVDTSTVKAGPGVKISVVKTEDGNAVKMECSNNNPVPTVVFKESQNTWMLSKYKYVSVDIKNLSKSDLLIESRLAENGWYSGGQNIKAGETRTIRAYIQRINEYPSYLDKKFVGMDALPGGIIKAFWWTPLHPDSIHDLSIVIINPSSSNSILISNIRGEGFINPPSEAELNNDYFPMIDEFGQLRHKEWPGKIHSLDELVKSKETENKDIKDNPPPGDWDKSGDGLKGRN